MSLYDKYILPKMLNCLCSSKPMVYQRQKVVPLATGEVLEVGCHMVHTTLILSELFTHVYAINHNPIDDNWLCKGIDNVTYEHMDAYKKEWKWDKWKNVEVTQWGKEFATKDFTGSVKAIKHLDIS